MPDQGKLYAEDVNFWQTGTSGSDVWMERTARQIAELGGKVVAEGFGSNSEGRASYMIGFRLGDDTFKLVWPVLPSKSGKVTAARIQAATSLYHYVKSVCLYAVVVGTRTAFFSHLLLPDGRIAAQVADDEIGEIVPTMLLLRE